MRGDNSICDNAIKGTARGKASVLLIEKSIGVWQHMGYTPKKYSNRRKGVEDQMGSGHIYGV